MTPPARAYIRLCSSILAPVLFVVLLWSHGMSRTTAAHLPAARPGVVPAIPHELPDGVHLTIAKPKATPPQKTPTPAARHAGIIPIPQELPQLGTVFSGFG